MTLFSIWEICLSGYNNGQLLLYRSVALLTGSPTFVLLPDRPELEEALPVAWEVEAEAATPLIAGSGGCDCSGYVC